VVVVAGIVVAVVDAGAAGSGAGVVSLAPTTVVDEGGVVGVVDTVV
jgi:hypothetical protein